METKNDSINKCKCSCEHCKEEHCGSILCGMMYTSKTKRGECSNKGCIIPRQDGSKYCFECSFNYANKKYERN